MQVPHAVSVATRYPTATDDTITRWHRTFFVSVAVFAIWVGVWGYFIPSRVDTAIPWLVPPLHARFIGALYLAGVVAMVLACLGQRWIEVRCVTLLVGVWTGMLFLISMLRLDDFDPGAARVWIWFGAYAYMPIVAAWLFRRHDRSRTPPNDAVATLSSTTRTGYLVLGVILIVVSVALLALTDRMVAAWPWKVDRLLAQIYAGPFLAFGAMNVMISRTGQWIEARIGVITLAVFAMLVLMASIGHRSLFQADRLATWFWFAGLVLTAALCASAIWQGRGRNEA